ncbi:Uncharacterised protein [Serratia proteamaculans]|uniref:hypothetical protein n=1 Tax=Serratia proteamaculans TaxID=28151 RepID=UPI00217A85E5|nr:hypothetical protein [Serratia proteamaculans]CAI1694709.1 Uncharacterised protein [Serratia proteamaculans]CAI2486371.1 Uncharacterised protein [Serratia proteamaculans]
MKKPTIRIYFSDFFNVSTSSIESYGAFNISLINDLPLFIDPFLLFNSKNNKYKELHKNIITYVSFLKEMAEEGRLSSGLIKSWFLFPEVKQNWFGFSIVGNGGRGLGIDFANALIENFGTTFKNFGNESLTKSSHLEKLCLIKDKVGKDSISDFTTNLIKKFLLDYTQTYALENIDNSLLSKFMVDKVEFDYETQTWAAREYTLPKYDNQFVLLTPRDILTKDEAWINQNEMIEDFSFICSSIPNDQLRDQLGDYFGRMIPDKPRKKDYEEAARFAIKKNPEFIDYFIKYKEENSSEAHRVSDLKVSEIEGLFIESVRNLAEKINSESEFYRSKFDTLDESYKRAIYLKQVIENNDGYKLFYIKGQPLKREADLQLLFRLTWYATPSDVNSEVNNGRGPVDYKISRGNKDKTLIEFKLASNSQLKRNLAKQVEIYEKANATNKSIKIILYFTDSELNTIYRILKELNLKEGKSLILIDARPNKKSASKAG